VTRASRAVVFRALVRGGGFGYDFISPRRRRRWYAISGVFLLLSIAGLLIRGVNLGIDFKGGSTYEFPANGRPTSIAVEVLRAEGAPDPVIQQVGQGRLRATTEVQSAAQVNAAISQLATRYGITERDVATSTVGPTWGSEVSRKALIGLVIFLAAVVAYLSFRFEPRMAIAAMLALIHDLLITIGIYVLVGFEVTPATVIAVLTILGFSLYDTVIVFDRIRELTRGLSATSRITYAAAANDGLNQTVVRSLNTSIIGVLPVASLLFVGAGLLGAGTLKDLALAQFVGILAGTYSSIFIATPLLVQLKERDPAMRALSARVARAESAGKVTGRRPAAVGAGVSLGKDPAYDDGAAGADRPEGYRRPGDEVAVGADAVAVGGRRVDPPRPQQRRKGKAGRPHGKRRR